MHRGDTAADLAPPGTVFQDTVFLVTAVPGTAADPGTQARILAMAVGITMAAVTTVTTVIIMVMMIDRRHQRPSARCQLRFDV
jgi:hypothetical protein